MNGDERLVIHVRKEAHYELAVHTISHATMTWDGVTEIFDFEASLQTRGKETAEGSDQRRERCQDKSVKLNWRKAERKTRVIRR